MTTEVGFKNFKGYFICAILIMQFLSNRSFKSAVVLAASQQISSYIKTARNIYMQLTRKERAEIHDLSEVEKLYFQTLVQDAIKPTAYVERNSGNTEAVSYTHLWHPILYLVPAAEPHQSDSLCDLFVKRIFALRGAI